MPPNPWNSDLAITEEFDTDGGHDHDGENSTLVTRLAPCENWTRADITAAGTSKGSMPMDGATGTWTAGLCEPHSGRVWGISLQLSGDIGTAGDIYRVEAYINGSPTGIEAVLEGGAGTEVSAWSMSESGWAFEAGDVLTVYDQKAGTPAAVSAMVMVLVSYDPIPPAEAFSLPDDTEMIFWLRPEELAGADGAAMDTWPGFDTSPDAVQATSGKRPTLALNQLDGYSGLKFDKAFDQWMELVVNFDDPFHLFAVFKQRGWTTQEVVFEGEGGGGIEQFEVIQQGSSGDVVLVDVNSTSGQIALGTSSFVLLETRISTGTAGGDTGSYNRKNGGSTVGNEVDGVNACTKFHIAGIPSIDFVKCSDITVVELLMVRPVSGAGISLASRLLIEAYFRAKYPSLGM